MIGFIFGWLFTHRQPPVKETKTGSGDLLITKPDLPYSSDGTVPAIVDDAGIQFSTWEYCEPLIESGHLVYLDHYNWSNYIVFRYYLIPPK